MKKLILLLLLIVTLNLFAAIPAHYYDDAAGESGDTLKTTLHNIIKGHTTLSYTAVWNALKNTDEDPNNSSNVILLYTGWSISKNDNNNGASDWNREHTWSKSHGDFGTAQGPGTDLHHLRPCDVSVNSAKSNLDFDEGGSEYIDGDGATGCYKDSDSWEPRDAVKGDVARMVFYMATRYEADDTSYDLQMVDYTDSSPNKEPYYGKLSVLLQWNDDDPPDDFERNRNDIIYNDYQHNRNPFIDHPEYANYIWGGESPSGVAAPNATAATSITTSGFIANWDAVTGATKYYLDIATDNGFSSMVSGYNNLDVGNVTSKTVTGLSTGTDYYYRVRAYDGTDTSSNSNTISVTTTSAGGTTTILSQDFSSGLSPWTEYSVASDKNWSVSSGESTINGYGGSAASEDWMISPSMDLSSYTSQKLVFKSWTRYSDTITGLEIKISTDYTGSGNPNSATWSTLTATLPAQDSQTWTNSGDVDISSYNQSDVYIAFLYKSTGTGGGSSTWWKVDDIEVTGTSASIVAPNATAATNITESGFTANWDAVSGATGYYLDVATDSGFSSMVSGYNNLDVGNVTSKAVTGLSASTDYYYRVRAYDASDTSSNSNTISVTTSAAISAPNATSATGITTSGFTANWDAVASATGYYFDVATDSGFSSMLTGYNNLDVGKVTSKAVTGLSASTDYYYRVRAYDASNTSSNSNTISVTTSATSGGTAEIIITELCDNKNGESYTTAYMEIFNKSNATLDLANYTIERWKEGSYDGYTYTIPSGTTVDANKSIIITRSANLSTFENVWGVDLSAKGSSFLQGTDDLYFTTGRGYKLFSNAKAAAVDSTNDVAANNRESRNSDKTWSSTSSSAGDPGETSFDEEPLPVTLSDFNASYFEHKAMLAWTTQSEFNNSYWNIYKSASSNFGQAYGINSQSIPGSGTTSQITHYIYQDNTEIEYSQYWYWIESVDYAGAATLFGPYEMNIEENNDDNAPNIVKNYGLQKNYPNPFNPQTSISFVLPRTQTARLDIYNAKGQHISQIFNGMATSDRIYFIKWNGKDKLGKTVPSGIYFYRLTTKNYGKTSKMLLLK